jgi:predicted MFS family arabinose efflux permease
MRLNDKQLLWAVLTTEIVALLPYANFQALLPQMSEVWQLSGAQGGWLVGVQAFAYLVVTPFISSWTDRIDAKRFMLAGCAVMALANGGFALFASGFVSALPWRALTGIGMALFFMPGMRVLTERLAPASTPRAITLYVANVSVGMGISFAAVGAAEEAWGWQAAFGLSALGPLLALPAVALVVAPHAPAPIAGPRRHPLDFRPLFANRGALAYVAALGSHTFEFSAMRAWMTAFLAFAFALHGVTTFHGLSPASVAALTNFVPLFASLAGLSLGVRIGNRVAIVCAMAVSFLLASFAGWYASVSIVLAVVFVFLHMFTTTTDQGLLNAGAIGAAQKDQVGMVMAAISIASFATTGLGPIALGLVLDTAGGTRSALAWSLGYAVAAGVPLVFGGLALRLIRPRPA